MANVCSALDRPLQVPCSIPKKCRAHQVYSNTLQRFSPVIAGASPLDTASAITNLTAHFPAGTSVKSLNHYEQLIVSHDFRDYDYGETNNLRIYNQTTPPVFDLSRVAVPTALFIGSDDTMADIKDVDRLARHLLGNPAYVFHKEFHQFSHMTWYTGTEEAFGEYFPKVLTLLNKYNPLSVSV